MRNWDEHQNLEPLILDMIEWIGPEPRSYVEVMDAWRTSCPRLTVWEDAVERGLVKRVHKTGIGELVHVTEQGRALLAVR